MLLVHQTGSVKIGEVVRYTLTYTPSADRILPSPSHLHVKVKNASAIPLRAAYLHGPYTLHVATYPSTFNPNQKLESPRRDGIPEFEPLLKAGGHWTSKLTVPEDIRETGAGPGSDVKDAPKGNNKRVTWIIEITSQILFSNSASVSFELLVGRDERSLDLGFAAIAGHGHGAPGQVQDHQGGKNRREGRHAAQPRGVYSKAVKLVVDDTTSLWNKPQLPTWDDREGRTRQPREGVESEHAGKRSPADAPAGHDVADNSQKQKKLHLVVLTHGLHGNLGADMLYLKESIDATARQAREDAKKRRDSYRQRTQQKLNNGNHKEAERPVSTEDQSTSTAPLSGGQGDIHVGVEDEDDEEVVVRGFNGNSVRTERGIQYLGKRLAKHVLTLTYPDQPFLPVRKSVSQALSSKSSIVKTDNHSERLPYTFTSISFIGHSLGGLVQTYAIAYIHKHSPQFFEQIKPVNFIAMASPLLGLSNENPMYVKFALDFGLVGRTGQDLGLTWRPPTVVRSGWSAMVGGLGANSQKDHKQGDPRAKPLLRILPTGPAHQVLRLFRNRTVYSNVVNDGIVPLRTSCLLFLDWRGLGKVEKARRENGLIGTMAGWGWAEITGASSAQHSHRSLLPDEESISDSGNEASTSKYGSGTTVPQPQDLPNGEDVVSQAAIGAGSQGFIGEHRLSHHKDAHQQRHSSAAQPSGILGSLLTWVNPNTRAQSHPPKVPKAIRRGQTVKASTSDTTPIDDQASDTNSDVPSTQRGKRPPATRGDSLMEDPNNVLAPPKTSFFESAGDILNPPLPPTSWLIDPSSRPRTIFHDRVYHPEDIPPPPMKRPRCASRSFSNDATARSSADSAPRREPSIDMGAMKVEEKIARAYHRNLSWRKVLVRLEPDAHNNMIVRRMFANAYGWPVIKHLCDTHFADTYSATTRDEHEPAIDRAKGAGQSAGEDGEEVQGQCQKKEEAPERTKSEMREAADELTGLKSSGVGAGNLAGRHRLTREGSAVWDDSYFEGSEDEDEDEDENLHWNPIQNLLGPAPKKGKQESKSAQQTLSSGQQHRRQSAGANEAEIADFLSSSPRPLEGHRGLGPTAQKTLQHVVDAGPADTTVQTTVSPNSMAPEQSPGGPTELGLRKSIEEQVGSPSMSGRRDRGWSGSHGVSEQVARLSMSKGQG